MANSPGGVLGDESGGDQAFELGAHALDAGGFGAGVQGVAQVLAPQRAVGFGQDGQDVLVGGVVR